MLKYFGIGLLLLPIMALANENCESLNNKIEDKTKYIVYEKVIEIERSLAVGGTQFIKSKKIPEYQSEISLLMQQANSMNCPAYTGDLTGKPYAKFAQACVKSRFMDRQLCDKSNWIIPKD